MTLSPEEFENEVRRVARALWPSASFDGAAVVDGRERDGIFDTHECVHCIEATVSRGKDKAIEDGSKLERLLRRLGPKHPTKFMKGWFVTLNEPTADQRSVIAKYQGRIVACSFEQFRSQLVDARSYLALRQKYPFGSVRDPASGAAIHDLSYVPLDLVDATGNVFSVPTIARHLEAGTPVLLTGDYGAGKSSTTRQIFLEMARGYWEGKSHTFPICLNLRDHHGQDDPVEMLERHARRLGYPNPPDLVRGWRAGYVTLLLDGFDEIASAGWVGQAKKLSDLRYRSMELLRRTLRETPKGCGVLITGRSHFFDSEGEMSRALGLTGPRLRLRLVELSPEGVTSFLSRLGWKAGAPEWLPSRPLLLAYLASRGLLDASVLGDAALSPAEGWDHLLDRIAEREAEIEAGIDPPTVRLLIEAVASAARRTWDGLGPVTPEAIQHAFRTVCGYDPDDRGLVLLQRLPGLGGAQSEDGARAFLDNDFVDAARSGEVFRYIEDPFGRSLMAEEWERPLGELGIELVALMCERQRYDAGKVSIALRRADTEQFNVLGVDLVGVLSSTGGSYDEAQVYLKEVVVDSLVLSAAANLSRVEFQDCVFSRLEWPPDVAPGRAPAFTRCHFALIAGRTGSHDMPSERFLDNEVEEFEETASTTTAILALPINLPGKVLLTVLKKLFAQKGAGRKENALYRGLDGKAQPLVSSVLELLRREGFAVRTRQGTETVWLPAKPTEFRKRALAMLSGPIASKDPVLLQANTLQ